MLALAFCVSVFSSVTWLIYASIFVFDKLNGLPINSLSLFDASIYVAFLLLPVFVLWMIFGYISQFSTNRHTSKNIYTLSLQMKKNLDYTDLLARIMLEAEQEIKDGFILNKFDVFISDMNELLAEIIKRSGMASVEQIENLWAKVQNGGKWSFGKVLIDISQAQSDFQLRMYNRSQKDKVLSGSVQEFVARYQGLITLLEKHDKEHVFLNLIETGVFGKVYSIFLPISDELSASKTFVGTTNMASLNSIANDANSSSSLNEPETFKALDRKAAFASQKNEPVTEDFAKHSDEKTFLSKFSFFKKKDKSVDEDDDVSENAKSDDPFSMALERSFGTEDSSTFDKEPKFDIKPADDNSSNSKVVSFDDVKISAVLHDDRSDLKNQPWHDDEQMDIEDFTGHPIEKHLSAPSVERATVSTSVPSEPKKTLKSLRREWEKMKKADTLMADKVVASTSNKAKESENSNDDVAFPFGSWVNEIGAKK